MGWFRKNYEPETYHPPASQPIHTVNNMDIIRIIEHAGDLFRIPGVIRKPYIIPDEVDTSSQDLAVPDEVGRQDH